MLQSSSNVIVKTYPRRVRSALLQLRFCCNALVVAAAAAVVVVAIVVNTQPKRIEPNQFLPVLCSMQYNVILPTSPAPANN